MPARALRVAGVWLSPAALLGMGPLVMQDGTRGLAAPLVLAGGAVLVAVLLAPPWSGLPVERSSLLDLTRRRWPASGRPLPLLAGLWGAAFLFLWAQLAAMGELAPMVGWPRPAIIGLLTGVLGLAAWRRPAALWLAGVGAGLALAGLVIPLAGVLVLTDPAWPRVWEVLAARPAPVFSAEGPWVRDGHAVRGAGGAVTVRVTQEQRMTLLGRGSVRFEQRDGAVSTREVSAPTELALRPGDALVVPDGFPIRFQASRRIPGAPSGLEWLDPPLRAEGWRTPVGLALTLALGALGLAPAHAVLPSGPPGRDRAAALGPVLVVVGLAAVILWSLYAAWLAPELYLGGVAGGEVYELPAVLPVLGQRGVLLHELAILGLAGGAIAAGAATLAGAPDVRPALSRAVGLALAATVTVLVRVEAWPLFLSAGGLAASTVAPAAVLACWRERLVARAVSLGAGVGLLAFVALAAIRIADPPAGTWLAWVAAWPAVVGLPLNVLVTWLASAGPRPSPHAPLPPGLADLHR